MAYRYGLGWMAYPSRASFRWVDSKGTMYRIRELNAGHLRSIERFLRGQAQKPLPDVYHKNPTSLRLAREIVADEMRRRRLQPLPPYGEPTASEDRATLMLVNGEAVPDAGDQDAGNVGNVGNAADPIHAARLARLAQLQTELEDWVTGRKSHWNTYATSALHDPDQRTNAMANCAVADAAEVAKISEAISAYTAMIGGAGNVDNAHE